jgi:hypothetical protein
LVSLVRSNIETTYSITASPAINLFGAEGFTGISFQETGYKPLIILTNNFIGTRQSRAIQIFGYGQNKMQILKINAFNPEDTDGLLFQNTLQLGDEFIEAHIAIQHVFAKMETGLPARFR